MPERIQLRRVKGWRLPPDAASVGRPSRFGNMFRVGGLVEEPGPWKGPAVPREDGIIGAYTGRDIAGNAYHYEVREVRDRADAVALFAAYIRWNDVEWSAGMLRRELGGKSLACWCPLPAEAEPDVCHARVLLNLANPETAACRHCGALIERCYVTTGAPTHGHPLCKGWRHVGYDSQPVIGHCCEGRMINPAAEPQQGYEAVRAQLEAAHARP